jgi:hypothetical protein
MPQRYLLSTAYFPPIYYFSLIKDTGNVSIEAEESYHKQTYRNRCIILTTNGPSPLIVPVLMGRNGRTKIRDIRIDYSKRWQQVHIRAIISAYKSSAYFEYYFEDIEKVITRTPEFLLDLNNDALETVLKIPGLSADIHYTGFFEPPNENDYDFRYKISPKKEEPGYSSSKEYYQVFSNKFQFVRGLSILDLVFNTGPDSFNYL